MIQADNLVKTDDAVKPVDGVTFHVQPSEVLGCCGIGYSDS